MSCICAQEISLMWVIPVLWNVLGRMSTIPASHGFQMARAWLCISPLIQHYLWVPFSIIPGKWFSMTRVWLSLRIRPLSHLHHRVPRLNSSPRSTSSCATRRCSHSFHGLAFCTFSPMESRLPLPPRRITFRLSLFRINTSCEAFINLKNNIHINNQSMICKTHPLLLHYLCLLFRTR